LVTTALLKITARLQRVATLPCEILVTFPTHTGQWSSILR